MDTARRPLPIWSRVLAAVLVMAGVFVLLKIAISRVAAGQSLLNAHEVIDLLLIAYLGLCMGWVAVTGSSPGFFPNAVLGRRLFRRE